MPAKTLVKIIFYKGPEVTDVNIMSVIQDNDVYKVYINDKSITVFTSLNSVHSYLINELTITGYYSIMTTDKTMYNMLYDHYITEDAILLFNDEVFIFFAPLFDDIDIKTAFDQYIDTEWIKIDDEDEDMLNNGTAYYRGIIN